MVEHSLAWKVPLSVILCALHEACFSRCPGSCALRPFLYAFVHADMLHMRWRILYVLRYVERKF